MSPRFGGKPTLICVPPPRGRTASPSPSANASSAASVSAEVGPATTSGRTPSTASPASAGRVCPSASASSFAWSVAAVCVIESYLNSLIHPCGPETHGGLFCLGDQFIQHRAGARISEQRAPLLVVEIVLDFFGQLLLRIRWQLPD